MVIHFNKSLRISVGCLDSFLIMLIRTYWGTLKSPQSIVNSTLTEVIREQQYEKNKSPVIMWYSK
jgi:hypothetical protein